MTKDKLREEFDKRFKGNKTLTNNGLYSMTGWADIQLKEFLFQVLQKEREEIVRHIKEDNFHEMISDKSGWRGDRFIHRGELLNYLTPKKEER